MTKPKFHAGQFVYVVIDGREIRRGHVERVWVHESGAWHYGVGEIVGGVTEDRIYDEFMDAVDAVIRLVTPTIAGADA